MVRCAENKVGLRLSCKHLRYKSIWHNKRLPIGSLLFLSLFLDIYFRTPMKVTNSVVIVWLLCGAHGSFACLVIQQRVYLFLGEYFVSYLLQLSRGDLLHLSKGFLPCRGMVVIEHLLGHRQCVVFLILCRNSHLTLQLAQGALELCAC